MEKQKCERCGEPTFDGFTFTERDDKGARRTYPVCASCRLEAEQSPNTTAARKRKGAADQKKVADTLDGIRQEFAKERAGT